MSVCKDQGQIAMKLLRFDNGVTLRSGPPAPVTRSTIGTAFDIAGRNVANGEGRAQAFCLAARFASEEAPAR